MPSDPPSAVRVEISVRTIVAVLVAIAAVWLLLELRNVVILSIFALVLVGTLNPLLGWFHRRGIGRVLGLAMTLVAALVVVSLLLLVTVPALIQQLLDIVEQLPTRRDDLAAWLDERALGRPLAASLRELDSASFTAGAGERLLTASTQVVVGVGYVATMIVLAVYLLADGQRALGVVYAVVPRDYHVRLARIIVGLETIVGGYVRGQLLTSAAITVFTFILLTLCGIEHALALAVFAGLTDVIPFVGGVLATAPAVAAAVPHGWTITIVVTSAMLIYQELESRVLVPKVYGRVLRLSPATVIFALLVGGTLMGIIGALLALPFAAALQMTIRELRLGLPGEMGLHDAREALDHDVEARYESASEGLAAEDASVIATAIAVRERELAARTPAP